jgi:hypothetical protein
VHSAFEVGFERAKTIGVLFISAIFTKMASVNACEKKKEKKTVSGSAALGIL